MTQKKRFNRFIVILLILTILMIVVMILFEKNRIRSDSKNSSNPIFGVQKGSAGEVAITLKPLEFKDGNFVVYMTVDTYSIDDLDKYNLKEIISFKSGSMVIKPSEVPVLSEHHNIGKLYFPLNSLPKNFEITISNLNRTGIRRFIWSQLPSTSLVS